MAATAGTNAIHLHGQAVLLALRERSGTKMAGAIGGAAPAGT